MKKTTTIFSFLRITLLLLLIVATVQVRAQRPGGQGRPGSRGPSLSILGKLVDEAGEPIPFASVAVFRAADSTVAAGGASDERGNFEIKVKKGNYYVQISFLSYETRLISGVVVDKADVQLKTIELKASATALKEVTVEAERSQMILKLDKRVFNVSSDLTNRGQNAVDILENIPSVDVDVEGNISLRNSQNVGILIDGKPSSLVGVSSNDALRLLQGDMVERVEVITNPSARYDAEGEVGIINIILKKEKKKGLNGVFEARAGYPARAGGSFNLNYRKDKLTLFGGYGLNYRERPGQGSTYHIFNQPDTTFSYRSEREHSRNGTNHNIRFGGGYDFNKYNSVNLSGNYSYGSGRNDAKLVYKDYGESNELYQTSERVEDEEQNRTSFGGRINYTRLFKRPDMKLTVDANSFFSDSYENAVIDERSDLPSTPDQKQTARTIETETNSLIQSDFEMPLWKEGKFEAGFKANFREIVNDYLVQDLQNGEFVTIPELDNKMVYTENIYAAYVMAGNKTKNLSYQAGLRFEYSDILTDFKRTNEINPRQYANFFPSANLSYEFKKSTFLQASYSRRISRPRHWFLFPFYNLSDNRNISRGNPNLDPVFTHVFELGYMKKWEKANFLVSPYYRYSSGTIERVLLADSNGINYRFPINLGTRNSVGLEVTASGELYKWWSVNGSFNFYREITEGQYQEQDYSADTYAWTARLVSKWRIKKKASLQASFRYNAPQKTIQGERLAMYNLDLAGSLDVLKGKGTLTLSVRDIFNTRVRRTITNGPDFYDETNFQWMSRYAQLTFSYRLNQKKKNGRGGGMGSEFEGDGR